MREVAHTDEARRELGEAAAWHDKHGSLGGANFVSAIDEEIERIREMPFASPPWSYAPRYRARTLRIRRVDVAPPAGARAIDHGRRADLDLEILVVGHSLRA